jgi:hypothetical protein
MGHRLADVDSGVGQGISDRRGFVRDEVGDLFAGVDHRMGGMVDRVGDMMDR